MPQGAPLSIVQPGPLGNQLNPRTLRQTFASTERAGVGTVSVVGSDTAPVLGSAVAVGVSAFAASVFPLGAVVVDADVDANSDVIATKDEA